jgi:hypothetical protein
LITITQKGSFDNTERYLRKLSNLQLSAILNKYGRLGVDVLANATPADSGMTASSWSYTIVARPGYYSVRWHNSNAEYGVPVAILIQYGHGTKNGGYVEGRDFIMPAIRPIFDQLADEAWKEVTKI